MAKLGETVSFTASKKRDLWVSDDGKFTIAMFTCNAKDAKDCLPASSGIQEYGATRMFVVKGKLPEGVSGISYDLTGSWGYDKKRKEVIFEVEKAAVSVPTKKKSIVSFLKSNCKGIGAVKANLIAHALGKDALDVCANHPEELKKRIPILTDKDVKNLKHGCQQLVYKRNIADFLGNLQLPESAVDAIAEEYGEAALAMMKETPYKLINLVSFQVCDAIAMYDGVHPGSRKRAVAALVEAHRQLIRTAGTVCISEEELKNAAAKLLNRNEPEMLQAAMDLLLAHNMFVRQGTWIYSKEDFIVERNLARKLCAIIRKGPSNEERIQKALDKWKEHSPITLSPKQEEAVMSLAYPISIVTGGPGTGKSTTLKACLDVYSEAFPKTSILCMAPTGRAAQRMSECTGMVAQTIHSACGLIPSKGPGGFTPQTDDKIEANLIAVDELSMVGLHLFNYLIDALSDNPERRIILLGDVDQLPSVTPGNVLYDLICCGKIKTTFLDRNYRQGAKSTIAEAAYAVNKGVLTGIPIDETFRFVNCKMEDSNEETKKIIDVIIDEYKKGVQKYGIENCIVLSPTHFYKSNRSSLLCTDKMNEFIQEQVNPAANDKSSVKIRNRIYRVGDRVVQTKNTESVMNGDLGTIVDITYEDEVYEIKIDFGGKMVTYDTKDMLSVELGYVITVHKTQGSEFACCIMPASMTQKAMLVRRLFYTAITRAKKEFVFVGTKAALKTAIETTTKERKSLLAARIVKNLM